MCWILIEFWPNVGGILPEFATLISDQILKILTNCALVAKVGVVAADNLILWWYFDTLAIYKIKIRLKIFLLENLQPAHVPRRPWISARAREPRVGFRSEARRRAPLAQDRSSPSKGTPHFLNENCEMHDRFKNTFFLRKFTNVVTYFTNFWQIC